MAAEPVRWTSAKQVANAMVTAIVALKVDRKRVNDVASQLSEMKGITEVYSVSGRYDLIALIRTKDTETLSDIVTGSMLKIDGIVDSETMLAFRVHSKHDLDSMFSIGVEE
ncbi:MAG: Lrp/AsnC ligand binding domain-containing protein [Chromatiaceae bacterium]